MRARQFITSNIEEFVDDITDRVYDDNELYITVVGSYIEIKNILAELLSFYETKIGSIVLESLAWSGYDKSYCLSIECEDGKTLEINVEKMWRDKRCLNPGGDEVYLLPQADSEVIKITDSNTIYCVRFKEEIDDTDDIDDVVDIGVGEQDTSAEGDGFTIKKYTENGTYTYSYYTNKKMTVDDLNTLIEELHF